MPGGGSRCPATQSSVDARLHYLRMEGKETFKNAVQAMQTAAVEVMRRCEIDITRIKCIIPHQANRRIIDAVGERLGATAEQVFINLHKYGNTSAASVAIANPPDAVIDFNEADFERAAHNAHDRWGNASPANLNLLLQFHGFQGE